MDAPSSVNLDNVTAEWFYEDSVTVDVIGVERQWICGKCYGCHSLSQFQFLR
jgi:hypothetical protein